MPLNLQVLMLFHVSKCVNRKKTNNKNTLLTLMTFFFHCPSYKENRRNQKMEIQIVRVGSEINTAYESQNFANSPLPEMLEVVI